MFYFIINSVDEDPWGNVYQIVVRRTIIGLNTTPDEETTNSAIRALFPQHEIVEWNITPTCTR